MSWEEVPRRTSRRGIVVAAVVAVVAVGGLGLLALRRDGPAPPLAVGPTEGALDQPRHDDAAFTQQRLDPIDVDRTSGDGSLLPDAAELTVITTDGNDLVVLDTASGDRRRIGVAPVVLDDVVLTIGDNVVVKAGRDVVRLTDGQIRPVRLAADHLLVPTRADDAVWVYSGNTPYVEGTATLIGLDGRVRDRIAMPAVAVPLAGSAERLVVETPAGVAAVDGDGGDMVARGTALASDGDRLAWLDCDGGLTCAIVIGSVDDPDGVRATVDAGDLPGGFAGLPRGVFSPDGRWLAMPRYRIEEGGRLSPAAVSVLDTTTGGEAFRADGNAASARITPLAWSPDSRWLLFVADGGLQAWPAGGGAATSIATDLGAIEALAVR